LTKLYAEAFADVHAHFTILQDLLAQKLRRRAEERRQATIEEGEDEDAEEDEDEDGEEEEEEEEEGSESEASILECDDEDEFEEVMRILGLRRATLDDTGALRLPSGAVAGNRDVAHIWRQRGVRMGGQLAIGGGPRKLKRAPVSIMLTNSAAGMKGVAVSHRQQAREGKKIIVFLRAKNWEHMKIGMNNNRLQTKTRKIRTGFGDASGGR